ncbi:hypothetical protein [Streptomyces tendae]|uniref:Uncharacterized protein n=1 Tax=Streptomyces tendae TaxID=1932 RepID=A0ABW7SAS3_STRTE
MAIAEWFTKGSNVVSLGALITSIAALTRTWSTSRTAKKNLRIVMRQEERRAIEPQVQLLQSKRKVDSDSERYSYLIHVGNPADSGNYVARAEMVIDYRSRDGVPATVKIPAERVRNEDVEYLGNEPNLEIPVNVSAREAVEGWVHFKFTKSLMSEQHVDRFLVLMEMGNGATVSVESIIPTEI